MSRTSDGSPRIGAVPDVAGIDVDCLAESVGLSRDTLLELLGVFVSASLKDLGLMERGIQSGDMSQIVEAAHSLKGAAVGFELYDIASAAKRVETAARENTLEDGLEVLDIIKHRLDQIARSIGSAAVLTNDLG